VAGTALAWSDTAMRRPYISPFYFAWACLAAVFSFMDVCRLLVVALLTKSIYLPECYCFVRLFSDGFRLACSHLRSALYELLFKMYLGFFLDFSYMGYDWQNAVRIKQAGCLL
jgi:hypothetical protein